MQATRQRTDKLEIGVMYGFRALFVLFVVNYHFWQQGWLGQHFTIFGRSVRMDYFTRSSYLFVDGLLLLSAFLLYLPYARARLESAPRPSTRLFYQKRIARILPSYLAAVLLGLMCIALPQGLYQQPEQMWTDLLSHLTFTFTFSWRTYIGTPLGGALWTVAIEVQLYLVFPLLARGKRLWPTALAMALCGWLYRAVVYYRVPDTAMWINQFPAFLDVFALGMLGAEGYCRLREWLQKAAPSRRRALALAACAAFALSCWVVTLILRAQSTASVAGHDALRLGQLRHRLPLALTLLACMLSASMLPRALQWLLSNRLMRFLSAISFNLYLYHQQLAVQMRLAWYDTEALHANPKQQAAYTLLCFSVSLLAACAATYGVEKPCAGLILNRFKKREALSK